jgi:signal transduction histidine kinase/CheY-like chemotaxis protein
MFRVGATLGVVLMPALGVQLALGAYPGRISPEAMMLVALVASVLVNLALVDLLPTGQGRSTVWFLLASGLAVALIPFMTAVTAVVRGDQPVAAPETQPVLLALAWVAGLILAMTCRAMRHLFPGQNALAAVPLATPWQQSAAALVLSLGFWSFCVGAAILVPDGSVTLSPVTAALAAAYAVTAASLLLRGLAALHDVTAAPSASAAIWAALIALAALIMATSAPEADVLGTAGTAVLLLLTSTLVAVALLRLPVLLVGLGLMLVGATATFAASLTSGDIAAPVIGALLMVAILAANTRNDLNRQDATSRVGDPSQLILTRFNEDAESWLARLNMEDRTVSFPYGSGLALGLGHSATFSELFQDSRFSGVLDLMQALQEDAPLPPGPIEIQLRVRDSVGPARARPDAVHLQTFRVHVLENHPPIAWLALVSQRREAALAARATRYEQHLSEAIVREERLLSIASHELRTPIAILSMLVEELKTGMSWSDVGASFEKTLERIVSILDDLRADSGAEGGLAALNAFTPREMVQQLLEVFRPAAVANGITIQVALPQQSDTPIRCDHGRVFIALSKLIHNAIIHSKGTEVVLNVFVTKVQGDELSMTWQVSDNGTGIDEVHRKRIFEPFETSGTNPEERPGLGLYTARKAIRLIGGDLVLHEDGRGTRFVLTHPARADLSTAPAEFETIVVNDVTPIFSNHSVLLVEDNKLVGEITSARLRKLFARVDWAEAGDAGLELFRNNTYDMLVVDQLLPGLIGSELVREIRKTNKTLPIIGITASTMGSECRDLEAAGANYALEKPLSFAQLKGLAEEFLLKDGEPREE